MQTSLTAPERETVVLMSDADDYALVTTWQRRVITKLEKNPAAEKLQDWTQGTSSGDGRDSAWNARIGDDRG